MLSGHKIFWRLKVTWSLANNDMADKNDREYLIFSDTLTTIYHEAPLIFGSDAGAEEMLMFVRSSVLLRQTCL